ncbi:hypothetical protein JCM17846_33490 [Iodidimonas nitroreducens]|uniref:Uncharacterized protein n=1 Tax=Iodidimonas nitroreducens TaxID=1236968 RepID=A0A5A7NCL5_9PROT|nr:hypothetical protein [Iodidimonas nitroreducens]GAK32784.1 hypothetical protein AQ1_00657 [alpha proteobacterium Q-1]GER05667.1 hypothetical protein JCM17846_33490 [Iodidimonas nitroreducens]
MIDPRILAQTLTATDLPLALIRHANRPHQQRAGARKALKD